jgi:hypothetical protein
VAENNGDLFLRLIKASQPHHLSFTFVGCVRDMRERDSLYHYICFYSKRRVKDIVTHVHRELWRNDLDDENCRYFLEF